MGYVSYEGEWKPRRREDGSRREQQPLRADEPFVIANEFAFVRCRRISTRNGERLEIEAPKRGLRIHLDAVELESLTWQTPETFAQFLRRGAE
jgi:hypothetical protein